MRILLITFMLVTTFVFCGYETHAADYTNSLLFKVTVENNGEEVEFEYENPTHYEWEIGSRVTKGEEAKEKVEKLFQLLNITAKPTVDELKANLEQYGFTSIDKFVIKWIDPKGNLYTWHWDKSEIAAQS